MRLGVSAALVAGRIEPGDVEIEGGTVVAVGLAPRYADAGARAAPGLVDLQVNGFAGVDLRRAGPAGWDRVGEALARHGTTAYQPTFISAPEPEAIAALRGMPAAPRGARLLGAHLEGPFLAPARRGTHRLEHLRPPDPGALERLLDAGTVTQVTLAPELPGADALIDALVARGIVVSAGHTDATAAEAHRAFDRGVRTVTHLHNAMGPGTPRNPGIGTAALVRPDVVVQLIADAHHLAPDTVRLAWRAAAGRLALVSDAVAAAPCAGPVRDAEGRLAGGGATLLDGARRLHALGVPAADALLTATAVPARLLGRRDVGTLAPGACADVIVLDERLALRRVLLAGEEVH
jgi:N-acetylglucosamine-6-phosphate deacetylase